MKRRCPACQRLTDGLTCELCGTDTVATGLAVLLVWDAAKCDHCGECERHYPIRATAHIYRGLRIPANEWGNIRRLALPAVAACKSDALMVEEV